ncbi:uncharacterized protein DUF805 [Palleronia aestuarii]|uniref:Uncharacterized protein DUF805 n=1 Tax=Palleronia aestuarii TaxID=568105 RepID=A0A2W7NY83_9RHOB|nr:DUF805 domain-containing protein [Palleronia aestuarii]PZX18236.1 uncharacterized protein DUF805 [Palleronia aestuarii]
MLTAIRRGLRNAATFSGRTSRSDYWYFILFVFLGDIAAGFLDRAFFGTTVVETAPGRVDYRSTGPLAAIFSLAMLLPILSAGWRRMHDTGRSGLYLFYPLIVVIGIATFMGAMAGFSPLFAGDFRTVLESGSFVILAAAFFVFLLSPLIVLWWLTRASQDGTNAYGPNPHEVSS